MPRREITGLFIPRAILQNRNLTSSDKLVLAEVFFLSMGGRVCYATNAHLAEMSGLSKNQVSKIISRLRRADLVLWQAADNRANRILRANLQNDDVGRAVHDLMRGNAAEAQRADVNDFGDFQ